MALLRRNRNPEEEQEPQSIVEQRINEFAGIRSQYDDGNPLFPDGYLVQIERATEDRLREQGIGVNEAMREIQQLMFRTINSQQGYERQLETLAEEVVQEYYGALLDNVVLDIRIVMPGEPSQQMGEPADGDPPEVENIEDEELRNEIYKRRVSNYLTSGSAISMHRIIHMPDYRDRLSVINPTLVISYDRLLKLNEILDGSIPIEDQENMWRNAPEGMAGSVKVEWPESNSFDNDAPDFLNNNDDEGAQEDDDSQSSVETGYGNPIIHARGIDFPMLVHETVKGIYELIMASGIPEDEETANIVIENADTYTSELIGHRIGPQLKQDLLTFVNAHQATNEVPNVIEHVFGKIIQLPGTEFLQLTRNMLLDRPEARAYIDTAIDGVVEELREYTLEEQFGGSDEDIAAYEEQEQQEKSESAYDEESGTIEASEDEDVPVIPVAPIVDDLSKMSHTDLQGEMDKALDIEDWPRAREVGKYLHGTK